MKLRIQAVIYSDPDHYPPIINGMRLMAKAGWNVRVLSREYESVIKHQHVEHLPEVQIDGIQSSRRSWREFLSFIRQVLRRGDKSASLVIGHDMHDFMAARLLATRLRCPLVYQHHDFVEKSEGDGLSDYYNTFDSFIWFYLLLSAIQLLFFAAKHS